jgi:DNA modification methylase
MANSGGRRPRRLTHGSLFTGIGGFDLGFSWASIDTLWQVEQSEFCRQILERHFPYAQRHTDVREVGATNLCRVDIISGGSPCQDISPASPRRAGLGGERSGLWREMRRICAELLPRWCIFENVPELRARGADSIAAAMEELGYSCTPIVVGAHALGALHERDRIWLVCHLDEGDDSRARGIGSLSLAEERELYKAQQEWRRVRDELGRTAGDDGRPSYETIRGAFYGVSHQLDRIALAALGNAVVPQTPMLIGSFIRQYEEGPCQPPQTYVAEDSASVVDGINKGQSVLRRNRSSDESNGGELLGIVDERIHQKPEHVQHELNEAPESLLYHGNAIDILRRLPDEYVQCTITSTPYWALRDYGTATWVGGRTDCAHVRSPQRLSSITHLKAQTPSFRDVCDQCGAIRHDFQLGIESTPEQYIANLVDVFRELKRTLRRDGTLWLVVGDTYNGTGHKGNSIDPKYPTGRGGQRIALNHEAAGSKSKDLVGIPWLLAFALRDDGWYLRSEIIWHKPNAMPESVKDRPTKSHENVFLLTKSPNYYYDADAIREPLADGTLADKRNVTGRFTQGKQYSKYYNAQSSELAHADIRNLSKPSWYRGNSFVNPENGRNKRSVWTIPTQPFKGGHFATFPEQLVELCLVAGTRPGDVVLDPFMGSGSTGVVAKRFGRRFIGIDLNSGYVEMARTRIAEGGKQLGLRVRP